MEKILKEAVKPAHVKTAKEGGTSDSQNDDLVVEKVDISNRENELKD